MKFRFFTILTMLIFTCRAFTQDAPDSSFAVNETFDESSGLFTEDGVLDISLKFDITGYRKKKDDQEYMDAWISCISNGDSITREIKLRARGEFRRKFCDMPPIMLNFDMDDSSKGGFRNINKIKMVTVCPDGNEEYLLKEYLAYKLYNVLTENSYNVRLLKVSYINTSKEEKAFTDYAFVIEPVELLAKRMESVEIKTTNLSQKNVKPAMMDRVAIFNYMIGNTDWSVPIAHNVQLFAQYNSEQPELAVPVPFDFDFSGLVNTHYAAPFQTLGLNSTRERRYLGMCRDKETFLKALEEFAAKKDEFYKVINNCSLLDNRSRDDMIFFLDGFFEELQKPEALARTLMRECIRF